jgi:bacterial/archaeal transporter family protein
MWLGMGALSGLMLGLTDIVTKIETKKSHALSVLFVSNCAGALFLVLFILGKNVIAGENPALLFDYRVFLLAAPKNLLMVGSLVFMYKSLAGIPLSYAGAIRASGPIWTLLGAYLLVGETLTERETIGLIISILIYACYAVLGRQDGLGKVNLLPALGMTMATIMSSLGTAYDKYISLSSFATIDSIQNVSAIERAAFCAIIVLIFRPKLHLSAPIIILGVLWAGAEYIYFSAYMDVEAKATILALLRRLSLVTGLVGGIVIFREKKVAYKVVMCAVLIATSAFVTV